MRTGQPPLYRSPERRYSHQPGGRDEASSSPPERRQGFGPEPNHHGDVRLSNIVWGLAPTVIGSRLCWPVWCPPLCPPSLLGSARKKGWPARYLSGGSGLCFSLHGGEPRQAASPVGRGFKLDVGSPLFSFRRLVLRFAMVLCSQLAVSQALKGATRGNAYTWIGPDGSMQRNTSKKERQETRLRNKVDRTMRFHSKGGSNMRPARLGGPVFS